MSDDNGSAAGGQPGAGGAGAGAAGGGAPSWFQMDGMAPEQTTQLGELVKAKGWKHPGEALMSYANLEKMFGADKAGRTLMAPKGDDDAEGWNAVYDRLGRPKDPAEYKLPVPDGDPGDFAKAMAPVLHKHGLTARQAQGLAADWNAMQASAKEAETNAWASKTDEDYKALKGEWGAAAQQNEELARRAVGKFGKEAGLDGDGLERLEKAIGTGPMLKLFHSIGKSFAEGTFVGPESGAGGNGVKTPEQAKAAINAKFADKQFMERYLHPDEKIRAGAIDEMMALQKMANPGLAG